ncbi:hypothetical protein F4778DRAFT_740708 [Xylariomycetidae sp. FL2044]|nr:hypothetical protein F4778DRAFT_740708 [Xylariomycetidae sp. FL2044]
MGFACQLAVAAALLRVFGISSAQQVITFPILWYAEPGSIIDDFDDFQGVPVGSSGDATTYAVTCSTEPCAGWENLPDFTYTMVLGPSTYDFLYTTRGDTSSSQCTFTGSPTATEATCTDIHEYSLGTLTGRSTYYTLPNTGEIYFEMASATLTVADGTTVTPTTTTTTTKSSSSSSSSESTTAADDAATTTTTGDSTTTIIIITPGPTLLPTATPSLAGPRVSADWGLAAVSIMVGMFFFVVRVVVA